MDRNTMRLGSPAELGQALAGPEKDWIEVLYIIEGCDEKGDPTPISKLSGGKVVLFPYEYHKDLHPGETWECRIIEDHLRFSKAVPIRKTAMPQWDENLFKPLPPLLARIFVEALEQRRADAVRVLQDSQEKYTETCQNLDILGSKIMALKEEAERLERVLKEKREEVTLYNTALKQYGPQAEQKDTEG